MASPRVVRTDRFGFMIPESGRRADGTPLGEGEDGAFPRPHEGPPPSSFLGGVTRGSEPAPPHTEKDLKERRARMMLENLRIKKWTYMMDNWERCRPPPLLSHPSDPDGI